MYVIHKIIWTPFLYIQVINIKFWLFPTAILVIIDNPFNFQDFLSLLKCI